MNFKNNEQIRWKENLEAKDWDLLLSSMQGHPLQSAIWGNGRKLIDNIPDHRWAAFKNDVPICLIRFEERRLLKYLKVAWIPKGPIYSDKNLEHEIKKSLFLRLKKMGYLFCGMSPWIESEDSLLKFANYTIWIDLKIGREKLWATLSKEFRYDVKRAERENVIVESATNESAVVDFFNLCKKTSYRKGFFLNTSPDQMLYLLNNEHMSVVNSQLFIAYYNKQICAGAFIICCGNTIHYMWGTTDRAFAKQRVGEILHWRIIEWAIKQNYTKYDLGGVIPDKNDGNFNFKKKLGGKLVALQSEQIYPTRFLFKESSSLSRLYFTLQPKLRKYTQFYSR